MGKVGENQGSILTGMIGHVFEHEKSAAYSALMDTTIDEIIKHSKSKKSAHDRMNEPLFRAAIETITKNSGEPSLALVSQLLDVIERQQRALHDLSDKLMKTGKGMGVGVINRD